MPETHILYGGLVTLEYDDEKHVYMRDGVVVPNVTSITGIKDKPWLLGWALNLAGSYVLKNWPKEPSSQSDREKVVELAKKQPGAVRDEAAEVGKEAHKWCEEHIKSQLMLANDPPLPTEPRARSASLAFMGWEKEHRVHYIGSEKKVYSLEHNFSGTFDILAEIDGEVGLPDLKTSNNYSDTFALQTAAYLLAYNEEHLTNYRNRWVLMLHKKTAKFKKIHLPPSRYDRDVAGFLAARGLYQWAEDEKTWR